MLPPTFANTRSFRASFVRGLSDMLICQELGVFILVLANASYDPEIQRFLHRKLKRRFDEIARQYRDALRGGRPLHGATADVLVFLKLTAMGYEALRMTEFREAGPWEIQFNHLRAFRPPRMSKAVVTDVYQRYDESAFNFNQPFLRKEVFWEGVLCGRSARLLYNKFPFAELHGLLVVDPLDKRPQFLTAELHRYIWNWVWIQCVRRFFVGQPSAFPDVYPRRFLSAGWPVSDRTSCLGSQWRHRALSAGGGQV